MSGGCASFRRLLFGIGLACIVHVEVVRHLMAPWLCNCSHPAWHLTTICGRLLEAGVMEVHCLGSALYDVQSPVGLYEFLETQDLEEARRWGVNVYCESNLLGLNAHQKLRTRLFNRNVRGMGFARISYGGDVTH